MNRDTTKRGKGRPTKITERDLGGNTYIQEIISRAKLGASLHDAFRVRSHTRFGGKLVSQPKPSAIT